MPKPMRYYRHFATLSDACQPKAECDQTCGVQPSASCQENATRSYGTCQNTTSCANWSDTQGCGIPCGGGGDNSPGYFCHPAGDGTEYNDKLSSHESTYYAYGCVDWSFQSNRMKLAEKNFQDRTKDPVYFGIGSYGTMGDQKENLGKCYRITATDVDRDMIVQNINSGGDVDATQFDLQMGAGGFGMFNACASDNPQDLYSMYSGPRHSWGNNYGGIDNRNQCDQLPEYPRLFGNNATGDDRIDNLRDLCKVGFDKNVRLEGGGNQTIVSIGEVSCPKELTDITGMKPIDASENYKPTTYLVKDNTIKCGTQGNSYCLTRMMDCRKPSASFKDNVNVDRFQPGAKLVQPCGQDGYTRIDNRCGCRQCYC